MIAGGIKPGEVKSQFEIFVKRTQEKKTAQGVMLVRDWEILLGDVSDLVAAKAYKEFLVTNRGYADTDVAIQRVDWIATTILEVE